jgi:hypothetical protein
MVAEVQDIGRLLFNKMKFSFGSKVTVRRCRKQTFWQAEPTPFSANRYSPVWPEQLFYWPTSIVASIFSSTSVDSTTPALSRSSFS